jgi:hypothetical protein
MNSTEGKLERSGAMSCNIYPGEYSGDINVDSCPQCSGQFDTKVNGLIDNNPVTFKCPHCDCSIALADKDTGKFLTSKELADPTMAIDVELEVYHE